MLRITLPKFRQVTQVGTMNGRCSLCFPSLEDLQDRRQKIKNITPNISHLTGIAASFHFKPSKKIVKPRYRIIFGAYTYILFPIPPTTGEKRYFDNVTGREKFLAHELY